MTKPASIVEEKQNKKTHLMHSYRSFLREIEEDFFSNNTYVRVPKKLVIDNRLSAKERILWIVLACFQYQPTRDIFPSRKRLAKLLGIRSSINISRLTRNLQRKGCLTKYYRGSKTLYELWFQSNLDDSNFTNSLSESEEYDRPSEYNHPKLPRPPKRRPKT